MSSKSKLYKPIDVWKKQENSSLIIFRCFEIVGKNRFVVQSVDFFHDLPDFSSLNLFEKQQIELFIETLPNKRSKSYSSLEKAIASYKKNFV